MPDGRSPEGGSAQAGDAVVGQLSTLLRELAAPGDDLFRAWHDRLRPGDVVGRFEILREVGRGGFGVVYEALDRQLGRAVAFKALRPARRGHELSADWLLREAEAVARLDHPSIVTLHDVGRCDTGPYLVEELLRGETLLERLRRGPLPAREAVAVGLELARGLAHAHGRGVLHRDLKPGNVFLTEDGRVKLLDFGLAHLLGTRGPTGVGTPAYMAPEQLRGEAVDARADVFSLGATLYEALAGEAPFRVKDGRSAALDDGPPPALPDDTPECIAALVQRCLARDPARRPASGQAVAEELLVVERALQTEKPARATLVRPPARSTSVRWVLAGIAATMAEVVYLAATRGPPVVGEEATAPRALPSVAVLPFADLSPGKDQGYFADGVAEEIRGALARVRGLKVTGRSSALSLKGRADDLAGMGERLGVANVLEGSLRKDGDRIRVTARLTRLADGSILWSESYDRKLAGVIDVQDEIARATAQALEVKLLPARSVVQAWAARDPEAYRLYLVGRALMIQGTDGSNGRAISVLERAVQLDADLAPAHAWLSFACSNLAWVSRGDERRALERLGRTSADRAVTVAPGYSTGYAARGYWRLRDRDWRGAERDFERAVELGPADETAVNGLAEVRMVLGRFEEGVKLRRRAVEMDPLDVAHVENLADDLLCVGELAQAREMARRAMDMVPDSHYSHAVLAAADLLEGSAPAALERFDRLPPDRRLVGIAAAAFAAGREQASLSAVAELERNHADRPFWIAGVHAWRGDGEAAFRWLARAERDGDPLLKSVKCHYLLRSLRTDPRYATLLERLKLPPD